jgi:hypothetical protein
MYSNAQVSPEPLVNVALSTASAASNVVIAAKNGYFVRVISGLIMAAGTVDVTLEDSDGTNITGLIALTAQTGFNIPECTAGAFDTPASKGLNILLGQAVQVSGYIRYQYVKNKEIA